MERLGVDSAASQEVLAAARAGKGKEESVLSSLQRQGGPADTLISDLLASSTMREYTCVLLSHLPHNTLLQQPQRSHTAMEVIPDFKKGKSLRLPPHPRAFAHADPSAPVLCLSSPGPSSFSRFLSLPECHLHAEAFPEPRLAGEGAASHSAASYPIFTYHRINDLSTCLLDWNLVCLLCDHSPHAK